MFFTNFIFLLSSTLGPTFIIGGDSTLADILKWILILVPVAAAAMLAYHALMKQLSDGDPGTIAEKNKKMKNVLYGAIIAVSASGLVTLFLSYFHRQIQ